MKIINCKPRFSLIRRIKRRKGSEPSPFELLPVEVKRQVASFLPIRDLLDLGETSKRINLDLDVVVESSPLTDRVSQNKIIPSSIAQCFAVVIPNQEESAQAHQTTFAFNFAAMSTGGMIWVIEQNLSVDQSPDALRRHPFASGKIVAEDTVYSVGTMQISFFSKSGKFYQFWVTSAAEMKLNDMMLHQVCFGMKPSSHVAFQFEVRRPRLHMCSEMM